VPKRRQLTTNLRCVTAQKNEDLKMAIAVGKQTDMEVTDSLPRAGRLTQVERYPKGHVCRWYSAIRWEFARSFACVRHVHLFQTTVSLSVSFLGIITSHGSTNREVRNVDKAWN
jgi:hypothetical protein